MYYYTTDERKGRWIGAAAALLYIGFWAALMLIVSFSYVPQQSTDGIMMDLIGDPGESSPQAEQIAQVQAQTNPPQPEVKSDQEEILTQEHEEAPVREQVKPKPKPKKEVEPKEKPRQVNPNAMFKPTANNATASTSAATTASSNEGNGKGGYDGDNNGTGGGGVDAAFSLGNRSSVGSLPLPSTNYGRNKKGKVVIEIYVDSNGYVARPPVYRAQGSTTNDSELVRVAIEAAKKAKFTTADNDVPQVGTITYTFKLK